MAIIIHFSYERPPLKIFSPFDETILDELTSAMDNGERVRVTGKWKTVILDGSKILAVEMDN